jgi:enoyl-CoA hydratase
MKRSFPDCRAIIRPDAVFNFRGFRHSAAQQTEDDMAYEMIETETHGKVGLIRLNRPRALNALCDQLMTELGAALRAFDADTGIGAIVLTGSEKAFAAGADIKEMQGRSHPATALDDFIGKSWEAVTTIKKPVIAAVAGYALGGGCELAMMCDLILAADTAQFGQPEINLGVIPGAGGTQRLTRAIGKPKAMEMILTGRMMGAAEAEQANLVARVVPAAELITEALKLGEKIAGMSPVAAALAKRAVNRAFETSLAEGIGYERASFLSLFGTPHQREGMAAFSEKRKPKFS